MNLFRFPDLRVELRISGLTVLLCITIIMANSTASLAQFQNKVAGPKIDEYCGAVKLSLYTYVSVGNTQSYDTSSRNQIMLTFTDINGRIVSAKTISNLNDADYNYYATDIQASCADSIYSPYDSVVVDTTPSVNPMTCTPNDMSDLYISGYKVPVNGGKIKMVLIKTDFTGNVLWVRSDFNRDSDNFDEWGVSVEVTSMWDVMLVGHGKPTNQLYGDHITLARFDRFGNMRWIRRYKPTNGESLIPYQSYPLEEIIDGSPIGICITGEHKDSALNGATTAMVMRVGFYGVEYWRAKVPSRTNLTAGADGGYDIVIDNQTTGNNLLVTGYAKDTTSARENTYLFSLTNKGVFVSGSVLKLSNGGFTDYHSYGQSIILSQNPNRVMIAGSIRAGSNFNHTYLMKSSFNGAVVTYAKYFPQTRPNRGATESIAAWSTGEFIATNGIGSSTLRDAISVMPITTSGSVNQFCESNDFVSTRVETKKAYFMNKSRAIDTLVKADTLNEELFEADSSRCYDPSIPPHDCCGAITSYSITDCTPNPDGSVEVSIQFIINGCGATDSILDPFTNTWVSSLTPITFNVPPGFMGKTVTVCILIKHVTFPNECYEWECIQVFINCGGVIKKNGSGIDDPIQDNSWKIFPNPALQGQPLTLSYNSAKDDQLQINIYDMAGHIVYTGISRVKKGSGALLLPVRELSAGSYIINCISENQQQNLNLIIGK